jgi:hypothetical protein
MNELEEARYHFALSEVLDMVRIYGYCNVINDLDEMIADEINKKLELVDAIPCI